MPTRKNSEKNIENRKRGANERQVLRSLLSPAQQIEVIDQRFGVGLGARKERAKLRALMVAV